MRCASTGESCHLRHITLSFCALSSCYSTNIECNFVTLKKSLTMASHLHNYLRTYRKRAGLSQVELALLLGCQSGAKVSRYEHTARRPSLETAFAYEVVLHTSLRDLFAGMYRDVEKQTRKRAWQLLRKLESADPADSQVIRKMALLRSLQGGKRLAAR